MYGDKCGAEAAISNRRTDENVTGYTFEVINPSRRLFALRTEQALPRGEKKAVEELSPHAPKGRVEAEDE